jgi:hypothetical protein
VKTESLASTSLLPPAFKTKLRPTSSMLNSVTLLCGCPVVANSNATSMIAGSTGPDAHAWSAHLIALDWTACNRHCPA